MRTVSLVGSTGSIGTQSIDVIEAEMAMRDGKFELAIDVARRADKRLPSTHPLLSRVRALLAQSEMFLGAHDAAASDFAKAPVSTSALNH